MTAILAIARDVGDSWSALISSEVFGLAADQCLSVQISGKVFSSDVGDPARSRRFL